MTRRPCQPSESHLQTPRAVLSLLVYGVRQTTQALLVVPVRFPRPLRVMYSLPKHRLDLLATYLDPLESSCPPGPAGADHRE